MINLLKHGQFIFHQFRIDLSLIDSSFRNNFDSAFHLASLVFSENDLSKLSCTQLFYELILGHDLFDFVETPCSLELKEVLSVKYSGCGHDINPDRLALYI